MTPNEFVSQVLMKHVFSGLSTWVLPSMIVIFCLALFVRLSLYWIVRSELRFARELAKRLHFYLQAASDDSVPRVRTFSRLMRALMRKTHVECFDVRDRYKLSSLDRVEGLMDRLFLLHEGYRRFVDDCVQQLGYLRRREGERLGRTEFQDIARSGFDTNPYFTRLFGVLPVSTMNDLLATLPGLFLVLGIFGTFVGIAEGLPELGHMDLANPETSKKIMDAFLGHISSAMVKSIVGIGLSALMGIVNTIFGVETTFYLAVTRLSDTFMLAWEETESNERISANAPELASAKPELHEEPKKESA
jgi:hypothetical protein